MYCIVNIFEKIQMQLFMLSMYLFYYLERNSTESATVCKRSTWLSLCQGKKCKHFLNYIFK